MSEYKFNPEEMDHDVRQMASLILSDSIGAGDRLQDVVAEISSEGEDYVNGFADALNWVRESLLPAIHDLGLPATKTEKRGALKLEMVAESALAQASEAIGSIYEPAIQDENIAVVACDDDEGAQGKQGEDGVWEESHIFSCEFGSLTIKCLRRDGIICMIAPHVITTFRNHVQSAEDFARWMCLITTAYTTCGLRVIYVEAPMKLEKEA